MSKIRVYTTTGSAQSARAKALLAKKKLDVVEINLTLMPEKKEEMIRLAHGKKTVPQIFFGDKHIGGAADLERLDKEGALEKLIQEVLSPNTAEPKTSPSATPKSPAPLQESTPPATATVTKATITANTTSIEKQKQENIEELYELVDKMRDPSTGVSIADRSWHLKNYKRVFIAKDLVDWMMKNKTVTKIQNKEEAVALGQKLVDHKLVYHVYRSEPFKDGYYFYRFQVDECGSVLNFKKGWNGKVRSAAEVVQDLRNQILNLYNNFLPDDGKSVDYEGLAKSEDVEFYTLSSCELQRVDINTLNAKEKLAFFLNIYNVLVIHGFLKVGPPNTPEQRTRFFKEVAYNIGGLTFSLNDIYHGVLRGNSPRAGSAASKRPFKQSDPRIQFVLTPKDPRVHFALCSGAKSAPMILLYDPAHVNESLTWAVENFLRTDLEINTKTKEVVVSKIFEWYASDFESAGGVLNYIHPFLAADKQKELESIIKKATVRYRPFNWDLNAATTPQSPLSPTRT